MAKSANRKSAPKVGKKWARVEAFEKLSLAFHDYKSEATAKKWDKKIKKASKLLASLMVPAKPAVSEG